MKFKDIVGQEKIIQELLYSINNGIFPHAILLLGKKGWGGLPLGIALSQYLMCEKPTDDSCGSCHNCIMMEKMMHPDVSFTFPTISVEKKLNIADNFIEEFREFVKQIPYSGVNKWLQFINAANSQGNISADQSKRIVDFFNLKSYQGNKKIHLIWMPEYLGKEGNVLLKLIEEPPKDSILIFVAEKEELLLGTIRSRLQKYALRPISQEAMTKQLIEKYQLEESHAISISKLAGGDFDKATDLIQDVSNDILYTIDTFLEIVYTNKGVGIIEWVDDTSKLGREAVKGFLQYTLELFNTAFRSQYNAIQWEDIPENERDLIKKILSLPFSMSHAEKISKGIQHSIYAISGNANIKTQLLSLCIEMQYWIKDRELTIL